MQEKYYSHQESMQVLKNLALEIRGMGKEERLGTLEEIVRLETEGKGNRFWLLIIKCLLAKPGCLPKALNLAEAELGSHSNLRYLPINQDDPAQPTDNLAHHRALSTFKNFFV